MDEKIYFSSNGIMVTNSRFVVPGQTFAMSGITSVKMTSKEDSKLGPFVLLLVGLALLAGGSIFSAVLGGIVIALVVYWMRMIKPTLSVVLSSASGESTAFASKNSDEILPIVEALNQSIIHRG